MMAEEKSAIAEKVVSRLTALRQEFGPEGKAALDEIVIGRTTAEVSGHAMTPALIGRLSVVDDEYRILTP